MVMDRFGEDIEKKFVAAGRKFSIGTVCYLALQLVRKYMHVPMASWTSEGE